MAGESVPPPLIADKIRRALPDPAVRKSLLGYLQDSRSAFEAEDKPAAADTVDEVIKLLEISESGR